MVQHEARWFGPERKADIDEAADPMVVGPPRFDFEGHEAVLRAPSAPLITGVSVREPGVTEDGVLVNDPGIGVVIERLEETLLRRTQARQLRGENFSNRT